MGQISFVIFLTISSCFVAFLSMVPASKADDANQSVFLGQYLGIWSVELKGTSFLTKDPFELVEGEIVF